MRTFHTNGLALSDNFVSQEGYAYIAVSVGATEEPVEDLPSESTPVVYISHALIDGDNFQDMWTQELSTCSASNADPQAKSAYIYG